MNATLIPTKEMDATPPFVEPMRHHMWWHTIIRLSVLLIAIIAFLECFFRLAGAGEGEFLQPDLTMGCVHIPGKLVTWRLEGYSHDYLSSAGLRDVEHKINKPAGVTRIALLGDSATEGMQVPLADTYGSLLEKLLNQNADNNKQHLVNVPSENKYNKDESEMRRENGSTTAKSSGYSPTGTKRYEVINFACSSYSTGQQWLQYEQQVRQYHPDIVILMYNIGDAVENVFVPGQPQAVVPRPYFRLDAQGKVQIDRSVLDLNHAKLKPDALMSFLRKNSRIFGALSQENLTLSINEPLYRKITQTLSRLPIVGSASNMPKLLRPTYALPDPWKVTAALIENLHRDTNRDGAQLVLLLFPNSNDSQEYAKQEALIKDLGKREHMDTLDLTPPFKSCADMKSLFYQYHFSPAGHELVAQQLLQFMKSRGY